MSCNFLTWDCWPLLIRSYLSVGSQKNQAVSLGIFNKLSSCSFSDLSWRWLISCFRKSVRINRKTACLGGRLLCEIRFQFAVLVAMSPWTMGYSLSMGYSHYHSFYSLWLQLGRVQRIQFPSPMATVSEQSEDRKQQEHKHTNTKMGGKSFVLMNFFCPWRYFFHF